MGKTRVHLLAKELGIETKDLIAQLDKLGMRGRKAQSALEDDEVVRVRAAPELEPTPEVVEPDEPSVESEPSPESADIDSVVAAELLRVTEAKPVKTETVAVPPPAAPVAQRGARILGRIDLKQATMRVEPAPTPVLRRPPPGAPGSRPGDPLRALREGEAVPPPAGDADKPKTGRHKKRVVKKQDVLETRESEQRGGG